MMRDKLGHAQRILEALTTSNHDLLIRETGALSRIAQSQQWTTDLRTPELRGYAESFIKSVAELEAAAKRRDLDTAASEYNRLTTSCYQCHKRLKDYRIAR